MQFRCKVATPAGQITHQVYVADTEQGLRHDLESKGLYVLSLQPVGGIGVGRFSLHLPQRKRISRSEFLIFNQELATLLRAGLPLVQSLDILRRRVPNPRAESGADGCSRARAIGQRVVGGLRSARRHVHRDLPRVTDGR